MDVLYQQQQQQQSVPAPRTAHITDSLHCRVLTMTTTRHAVTTDLFLHLYLYGHSYSMPLVLIYCRSVAFALVLYPHVTLHLRIDRYAPMPHTLQLVKRRPLREYGSGKVARTEVDPEVSMSTLTVVRLRTSSIGLFRLARMASARGLGSLSARYVLCLCIYRCSSY